ncbi:MAG: hypothetical protein ACK4GN_02730 [Runella sp.]
MLKLFGGLGCYGYCWNNTYLRAAGTKPNGREGVADKLSDDPSACILRQD